MLPARVQQTSEGSGFGALGIEVLLGFLVFKHPVSIEDKT